jgi:2-polyprenyl-3-methyl-5-hydroxy-6-metoxy-1,4-benzoquinol methylase
MPKSYTGHEACYRDLRKSGCNSWDQYHKVSPSFEQFYMRSFVEMALSEASFSFPSSALEIGCGTGPLSCFLATQGFQVDGVDISATAIAIAEEESRARGLNIRYRVADVCHDSLGVLEYDLIVDGHCLHCIVDPNDRRGALSSILNALTPNGQFWVDSMIATPTTTFGDSACLDSNGVLWMKTTKETEFSDQRSIDGTWHLPTRKLHITPEAFASELKQAGFSIEWSRNLTPDKDGEPAGFQAICKKH